jgi:hypothetical protein
MKNTDQSKSNKKKVIMLSILGGLIVLIILAFALPLTKSDGTEKFTGKEAALAKQAIGDGTYAGNTNAIPDLAVPLKIKATAVYKLEPAKQCGGIAQGYGSLYAVDITKITFFGIEQPGYAYQICVFDK